MYQLGWHACLCCLIQRIPSQVPTYGWEFLSPRASVLGHLEPLIRSDYMLSARSSRRWWYHVDLFRFRVIYQSRKTKQSLGDIKHSAPQLQVSLQAGLSSTSLGSTGRPYGLPNVISLVRVGIICCAIICTIQYLPNFPRLEIFIYLAMLPSSALRPMFRKKQLGQTNGGFCSLSVSFYRRPESPCSKARTAQKQRCRHV